MVRGKSIPGNGRGVGILSSSETKETQNDDDSILPRVGSRKTYSLSSPKPEQTEEKIFSNLQLQKQLNDTSLPGEQQKKRGRGRPRKNANISSTVTINETDADSSRSTEQNDELLLFKNVQINHLNHQLVEFNNDEDDDDDNESMNISNNQHNIISVIEIVDESQDSSIIDDNINNIDKQLTSSENNMNEDCIIHTLEDDYDDDNISQNTRSDSILAQRDDNSNQHQIDSSSIIIEEVIDLPNCLNYDEPTSHNSQIFYDTENIYNTESIITISSEENSNFKNDLKSRDTPISDCSLSVSGGGGSVVGCGESASSPDILHVHINPNSARTYQNKRRTKNNFNSEKNHNIINNKIDKHLIELNDFHNNIEVDETFLQNENINIECRRSSRKKVMKYDVRDLLNKNRKKIQIEARIDSLPKKSIDKTSPSSSSSINSCASAGGCENKISSLKMIPKTTNEFNEIIIRNPEQLIIKEKPIKNLIQIQNKINYENGMQLPPPPPLKPIAELDRKFANVTTANGLYEIELNDNNKNINNSNNKIYSFQNVLNSASIIKNKDSSFTLDELETSNSKNQFLLTSLVDEQAYKNASQVIVTTSLPSELSTTFSTVQSTMSSILPPPVLSSMVKSPLLNIKFKHQNLAIRKSLDSFKNSTTSLLLNNLKVIDSIPNKDQDVPKESIEPQIKIVEITTTNPTTVIIPKVLKEETIVKQLQNERIKGKRGRPAKNKLSQAPKNFEMTIKPIYPSSIKTCDNENTLSSSVIDKSDDETIISEQIENEIKLKKSSIVVTNNIHDLKEGKQSLINDMTLPNTSNLNSTNLNNIFNGIEDFKMMNSTVKIKRDKSLLSNRTSTENIFNFTNRNHEFPDNKIIPDSTKDKLQDESKIFNETDAANDVTKKLDKSDTISTIECINPFGEKMACKDKEDIKLLKKSSKNDHQRKHSKKKDNEKFEKNYKNSDDKLKCSSTTKKKCKEIKIYDSQTKISSEGVIETTTKSKNDKNQQIILPKKKLFLEELSSIEAKFKPTKKMYKKSTDDIKRKLSVENLKIKEKSNVSKEETNLLPLTTLPTENLNFTLEGNNKMTKDVEEHVSNNLTENIQSTTKNVEHIVITKSEKDKNNCTGLENISQILEESNIDDKVPQDFFDDEPKQCNFDEQIIEIKTKKDEILNDFTNTATTSIENATYDSLKSSLSSEEKTKIFPNVLKEDIEFELKQIQENQIEQEIFIETEVCIPEIFNQSDSINKQAIKTEEVENLSTLPISQPADKINNSITNKLKTPPRLQSDSNDPLKDIEKFLEAADNLLSRSLSSEDETETVRRRRPPSRFKDLDDEVENNSSRELKDEEQERELKEDNLIVPNLTSIFKEEDKNNVIKEAKTFKLDNNKISEFILEKDALSKLNEKDLSNLLAITIPTINYKNQSKCSTSFISSPTEENPIVKTVKNDETKEIQFEKNAISEIISEITSFSSGLLTDLPEEKSENLEFSKTLIEKRISGPRTPPLPPPTEKTLHDIANYNPEITPTVDNILLTIPSIIPADSIELLSSNSELSNSNISKLSIIPNINKNKSDDILKLTKKFKKKDEMKSKKKYGLTEELKRTFKELKKYKNSSQFSFNKFPNTLSKGALKSFIFDDNAFDRKSENENRYFDEFNSSSTELNDNQNVEDQNNSNIRRSHRIKTITKSQNHSVGRGLVRDRERYDKEFDDIKPDLAEIEEQNAKFLKDMEERLSQFRVIRDNEYKCERIISKEAKKMICDCFLTRDEEERGEFGCGEDCLNRLLMIECGPKCTVGDRCTNRRFQRAHYAPCKVFQTEKKGCGIMADAEIPGGQFIMEYVGEVLNSNQFEKRAEMYSLDKNKHYYFMALRSDAIIDATTRGNISRFINHSCNPNAETQKWTVNGELRIGFFTTKTVAAGEEITFDYQFQRYGKEAQRCYCESYNCRGWIGEEPDDTDEEQDEESDDEEKSKSHEQNLIDINKDNEDLFKLKSNELELSRKNEGDDADKENVGFKLGVKGTNKKEKKVKRRGRKRLEFGLGKKKHEFLDDPDLEDEVLRLLGSGLKNQLQTLCLSRMIVRAKQFETRLNLLEILREGEMSCRRLFLDYHGLKLLHGWMSETSEQILKDSENDLQIRLKLLETLENLPIPNKTMLKDSKVFQIVQNWSEDKTSTESSPNTESPNDNSNSGLTTPIIDLQSSTSTSISFNNNNNNNGNEVEQQHLSTTTDTEINPIPINLIIENPIKLEIKRISSKLILNWDGLPEVFRIPKKERVEQMKEHEREANKEYDALKLVEDDNEIRRSRDRFTKVVKDIGPTLNTTDLSGNSIGKYKWSRDIKSEIIKERRKEFEKSSQDGLSKLQRRQIFAAKVAQDEAEKRMADEKREFEIKCKFYGLDPMKTYAKNFPFCVNPATGQWYTMDRRKIPTPPSHAHIKVPTKPQSTKPEDYQLPPLDLPPFWKFAIDSNKGRIYYYHIKIRIPQWEPPIKILPLHDGSIGLLGADGQPIKLNSDQILINCQNDNNDSSDSASDSGESDTNKDQEITGDSNTDKISSEQKKNEKKKRRHSLLVQERPISPRREEDRAYNQMEMRRYKENKEKIRRRKEEIKRRKVQLARLQTDQQSQLLPINENSSLANDEISEITEDTNQPDNETDCSEIGEATIESGLSPLPIADYLISSDEEDAIKNVCDSKLIDKIVKGEKIVDDLDAININRPPKRLLSVKENLNEHKSKKNKTEEKVLKNDETKKPKSSKSNPKYLARKAKEKFRTDIAGIIVLHLTPYKKDTCKIGRIIKNEDFKHLARKLTHFVMVKELKHCDLTGQHLVVTDSVKNKSREFIKKYMAKYGEIYKRPENDPEFKEIPH